MVYKDEIRHYDFNIEWFTKGLEILKGAAIAAPCILIEY